VSGLRAEQEREAHFELGKAESPSMASGPQAPLHPKGRLLEPHRALTLYEEEVPREGARVTRAYQYTRWLDGSTYLWAGRRKQPGRGERSSGLRFDLALPVFPAGAEPAGK